MRNAGATTTLAKRWLIPALCVLLVLSSATRAQPSSESRSTGLARSFELLLIETIPEADLVAHVEVIGVTPETRHEKTTRYRIDVRVLERFKGPDIQDFVYHQEIEEDEKGEIAAAEDVIGSRMIVTLHRSTDDNSWLLPDGGYSFPDHNNLIATARRATRK